MVVVRETSCPDRNPSYVEDRRATPVSKDTTIRVAQNVFIPSTHIYEESQSEGKRNVACHTGIVNRVPQFASRYQRIPPFPRSSA